SDSLTSSARRLSVDEAGAIHIDGAAVPLSPFLCAETRKSLANFFARGGNPPIAGNSIAEIRRTYDEGWAKPVLAKWLGLYPADIKPTLIGGVQTDVVTPKSGIDPRNKDRVLINLHGGAFMLGARYGGQNESVPI